MPSHIPCTSSQTKHNNVNLRRPWLEACRTKTLTRWYLPAPALERHEYWHPPVHCHLPQQEPGPPPPSPPPPAASNPLMREGGVGIRPLESQKPRCMLLTVAVGAQRAAPAAATYQVRSGPLGCPRREQVVVHVRIGGQELLYGGKAGVAQGRACWGGCLYRCDLIN